MSNYIKVNSSNINAICYEGNDLLVEYKSGTKYRYKGVPKNTYDDFMNAESKGRFMNESVKGKFEYERLSD